MLRARLDMPTGERGGETLSTAKPRGALLRLTSVRLHRCHLCGRKVVTAPSLCRIERRPQRRRGGKGLTAWVGGRGKQGKRSNPTMVGDPARDSMLYI
jgi:hypothetical protein